MRIEEILRYSRPYGPDPAVIDGHRNYCAVTNCPGHTMALLERGINPIKPVVGSDGKRRPAILISSSPHKVGSAQTPWQDVFTPDQGHIRYFGDAKTPGIDPGEAAGNKVLLEAFGKHVAMEEELRADACPIVFFQRVPHGGLTKGYVKFQGFGIINRVELITQFDQKNSRSFPNYVYDFTVFSLAPEHERFD